MISRNHAPMTEAILACPRMFQVMATDADLEALALWWTLNPGPDRHVRVLEWCADRGYDVSALCRAEGA